MNMSVANLIEIQRNIYDTHSTEACQKYLKLIRRWMCGKITLEVFDKEAQKLISLESHTKFLVSLINWFESTNSFKKVEPNWQVFYSRTTPGWIPDIKMIKAWTILSALEHNLESIDEEILSTIFFHIRVFINV